VDGGILRGLRRREPAIDLLRSQDFLPHGTPDPLVLEWAAQAGRILLTNDRNTMVGYAYERVAAGLFMPGLVVTTNDQPIGGAIEDVRVIAECMSEAEIGGRIIFLPLR
jgi:hypothetical protein